MPDYPVGILPHEAYKERMDIDGLARDVEGACVVRRVAEKPLVTDRLGVKVFENCDMLQASDILDMSSFLLGGKYEIAHLPFMDKSGRDWKGEKSDEIRAALREPDQWVCADGPSFPLMMQLSRLHLQSFPYRRTFDNVKQKKEFEAKYRISEFYSQSDKEAKYAFAIRFHHVPTLFNYWHFEMRLYPSLDEAFPRKDEKKNWMRVILNDFICKEFLLAIVEDEEKVARIDTSYYLK